MNTKQQFLQAVQILAQGDSFILQAAQRVREETLPHIPGGAALEFVAAMEKFKTRVPNITKAHRRQPRHNDNDGRQPKACIVVASGGEDLVGKPVPIRHPLTLPNALRVKSAEYWLKLGQPVQALMELERLPRSAMKHPWAVRVHVAAIGAAREMNEMAIQE